MTSWLPIRITSTDKQIEALIKSSDQSVDEKANTVGMYSIIKVQGFDIEEGKLVKPRVILKPRWQTAKKNTLIYFSRPHKYDLVYTHTYKI
jgi:hypothetical protein